MLMLYLCNMFNMWSNHLGLILVTPCGAVKRGPKSVVAGPLRGPLKRSARPPDRPGATGAGGQQPVRITSVIRGGMSGGPYPCPSSSPV